MKILLDSHTFIWFVLGDRRCSKRAREAIGQTDAVVFVSAVTAWEVATKVRIGKWPEAAGTIQNVGAVISALDFKSLAISVEHGQFAGSLSGNHKDPFDRILAAQSHLEAIPLVTADAAFQAFGTQTIW